MKALLQRLRKLLSRNRSRANDSPADSEDPAAHPLDEEPEPVHAGKRNLKQWYTSHWDWDYMPREDMERLLEESGSRSDHPQGRDSGDTR